MMDFNQGEIVVRYYSDLWGPFSFNFSDALPDGDMIVDCTVRSFFGRVKASTDILSLTETTSDLIDGTLASGTSVDVKLQYPGASLEGKHSLVFEVTTIAGAKHSFFFYKVVVE